jgi:hypothetical protein
MKAYTFTMNGHVYFSLSKREVNRFRKFWGKEGYLNEFNTTWKLQGIERAPKWVPEQLNLTAQIEYGK